MLGWLCYAVLSRFICVWPFATLWTVAHQAPLSVGFSWQEYWSGFMCPPPGDLSNPGIEPLSLKSPALAGRLFTTSTTWEALWDDSKVQNDIIQITNCWLRNHLDCWLRAWFSFIQPSSQDCLGCLIARQLDSIRRVLSGENKNFRSLKTWLQRLQNIISATYYWWKWVTVPAQNQCGMGTMRRCEH